MATPALLPDYISFEAFLARSDESRAEWVDGEIHPMAPVNTEHDDVRRFIELILETYVRQNGLGRVYGENVVMRLEGAATGRCPDIHFVRADRLGIDRRSHLEGPVDLAVEVVSPESRGRDRGVKFYEYEEAGVTEYWLIDPIDQRADFYVRGDDGLYLSVPIGTDHQFESRAVPGFWIDVRWFWEQPHPTIFDVARAWGMI